MLRRRDDRGMIAGAVTGPAALLDSALVKAAARQAGFHLAGIARAEPLDAGPLDRMLERGFEADMAWLRTRRAERLDPARLLPGARSVVALGLGHCTGKEPLVPEPGAAGPGGGKVARYARGRDYHIVMRKRLAGLASRLRAIDPDVRLFASADVAPVMEKAWAERAGIGWVGKNGCLINRDLGSWVLLATVILDRDLEPDAPHPEMCGSCDACLRACPTGALPEPGLVDARLCLSFQTIERRGPVPEPVAERSGGWAFGCDDCQSVCPWNRAAQERCDPDLAPRPGQSVLDLGEMLRLGPEGFHRRFDGTALARARHDGLLRNAILAAGWLGERRHLEAVRAHLASELPGVRQAARWALARLGRADLDSGAGAE